jgi:hypothetical protein
LRYEKLNTMHIRKFWHHLTTTRHARTLEAELALERAVIVRLDAAIAQQGAQIDQQSAEISQQGIEVTEQRAEIERQYAEIARLRAENRALLNSILGIAGVPPLPATDADLAAAQASLCAGASFTSVGARHAVPERATSTHSPSTHNRATLDSESPASSEANGAIQPSSIAGHGSAVPLPTDTPAADFRTAGVSPAPLPLGLPRTEMLEQQQNPNSKTPARRRRYENHSTSPRSTTPHVAAPTRRRSWPQIHRLLEFESAQKEKPAADPLPPARV